LRDKTLHKMAPEDFEAVVRVHLQGSAWCSRAALPVMQAQQYGRIVMTTSAAGLYGNFGQSNYGAAKLAVVGLMNTLKHEGGRFGVKVNTIAPVALTRMTEGLPLAQLIGEASPERVAAGVAYLASDACEVNGCILSAGAGYFSTVQIVEGLGMHAPADDITPEFVAHHWGRIADMSAARPFDSAIDALMGAFGPAKA
jgi:NAD(P)-dependent dehydrogenase (short-subunit alcohol dehydrogenase family)